MHRADTTPQGPRIGSVLILILAALALVAVDPAGAEAASHTLTVSVQGQGTVTNDDGSLSCGPGSSCSKSYAESCAYDPDIGRPVCEPRSDAFTATPGNGYRFAGWDGCDAPNGNECSMLADDAKTLIAHFADSQAPTVTLGTGSFEVSKTAQLTASASDNVGVSRVEFRIGGTLIANDTSAPFSADLDTTAFDDGLYDVEAKAFDAEGNAGSQTKNLRIDNTGPVVSIESGPADGAKLANGSTATWTFSATDEGTSVNAIECSFVRTGQAPSWGGCETSSSYSATPAAGKWTFSVRAKDQVANVSTKSRSITISEPPPSAQSYERSLTLSYAKRAMRFKGTLSSVHAGCGRFQTVKVYKQGKTRSKLVATAGTSSTGSFKSAPLADPAAGKYYAAIGTTADGADTCLSARSPELLVSR